MILHRCEQSGCRERIPTYYRWCPKHWEEQHAKYEAKVKADKGSARRSQLQHRYDLTSRSQERDGFYKSGRWKQVREFVYARDQATCQVCGNVVSDRKIVDHVHPLKLSDAEALDTSNLWTLCYACHSMKTKLEQSILTKKRGEQTLIHLEQAWWQKVIRERRHLGPAK